MSTNLTSLSAALADQAQQMAMISSGIDTCWVLICSALVIIMQVGFAYVEAGNVRVKNVRSILLKNTVDYVLGGILFFTIGNGVARGKSIGGFIGGDSWFSAQPSWSTDEKGFYYACTLYTSLFACTTSTIISGAIAERMRLSSYILMSVCSPVLLFCLPAHWVWNADGFLAGSDPSKPYMAMSDFSGGVVVHMVGGLAAIVAALFTGPRIGRFRPKTGYDRDIEGHSVVLGGLGTWLILFGWIGFNAGSSLGLSTNDSAYSAALAALNTFLAIIMGAFVSIVYHTFVLGKLNLGEMFNGMLAGAASITAGCGFVSPYAAIITGLVGGLGYILSVPVVARRFHIDDPLNAISVHFTGGLLGAIMVGFFHETEGLFVTGTGWKLAAQCIGILIIAINTLFWSIGAMLLYTLVIGPVRVTEKIEIAGCDVELDGIRAYENSEEQQHMKYSAIVANPDLHKEFLVFLKCIYCHQNVEFLNDLASFEKGVADPTVDSRTEAQSLCETYISADGTDPLNIPEWQITRIQNTLASVGKDNTMALQSLFTISKNEVHSILDKTIATHFSATPIYQKFAKRKTKPQTRAPLHFFTKLWCFKRGAKREIGRARPYDPLKKFVHTEDISDVESDDDDDATDFSLGMSRIAPTVDSEDDY